MLRIEIERLKRRIERLEKAIRLALVQQPYMATRVVSICDELQAALDGVGGYPDKIFGETKRTHKSLLTEIEAWKDASGLERGGDPDGVTPDDLRKELARLRAKEEGKADTEFLSGFPFI